MRKKRKSPNGKKVTAERIDMSQRRKMVIHPVAGLSDDKKVLIKQYKDQINQMDNYEKEIDYSFVVHEVTGKIYDDITGSFIRFANRRLKGKRGRRNSNSA